MPNWNRKIVRFGCVDVFIELRRDDSAGIALYMVQGNAQIRITDWAKDSVDNRRMYQDTLEQTARALLCMNVYRPGGILSSTQKGKPD